MNQLYKRLHRRKVSRKDDEKESECAAVTSGSGSLVPSHPEVPVKKEVPVVKVPPVESAAKVLAPAQTNVNVHHNRIKLPRWRSRKSASSSTSTTMSTTTSTSTQMGTASTTASNSTPLPLTPRTDPSLSPWENPWESPAKVTASSTRRTAYTTPSPRQLQHAHSPSPSPPSSPWSSLALIEKDPIVRLALEAMADDGDDDEHDTCDKTDPSDPAYLRNRITRAAAALDKSGNVCFERGEYDQAFERYSKALTLKKRMMSMGGTDTNSTSNSNHTSTSTDKKPKQQQQQQRGEHNNNNNNSSNKNNKGQQQEEVEDKSILASLATSINNTAYLKQRAGHASTDETMASYLKSLQIKRDILGPDHLSVGKTLNNIGSVFYLKREFEPALAAYKDACRIMTAVLGAEHLDVGTVVCNIGDVYSATALAEQALEQYRRALPIRWKHLGPKDPKVVRLMEQISSLEMGRLPVPAEDHLSDSESEEFAEQDKKRHAEFKQDLRTLQRELEEDMKFFDLMERQAAIEMVKDKVRVFREMRELANPQLEPEKVKVNASVNANANVPINNTPSYVQAWQQHQQVKLHLTPAPAATPSYVQAWQQHQQGELHLTPLLATVVETETGSNSSPSSTQHMESEYLSLPDQPRATQSGALAPRKPTLSAEQRQNALSSVRDRLARLRESRDFIKSGLAGDALPIAALPGAIPVTRKATGTTKTMGHQSYMEPTASSRSKTHTASPTRLFVGTTTPERKKVDESAVSPPTRLFLGTPERENVDEGINNLRNSPTSSPSGSVGAYNAPTVTNTTTAYDDCMNREHDVTKKLIEREIRATAGIGSGTVG